MKHFYFGNPLHRKDYETQVATPVGLPCLICREDVAKGDMGTMQGNEPIHYECALRGIAGPVAHQLAQCSCHGGKHEDPPGLTQREAAKAAATLYSRRLLGVPTFALQDIDGYPAIRCLLCNKASFSAGDIEHRYCGRCHIFHDVVIPPKSEKEN